MLFVYVRNANKLVASIRRTGHGTDNVKGSMKLQAALGSSGLWSKSKSAFCKPQKQQGLLQYQQAESQTRRLIAVEVRIVALEKQTFQPFSLKQDLIWNPLTFALEVLD